MEYAILGLACVIIILIFIILGLCHRMNVKDKAHDDMEKKRKEKKRYYRNKGEFIKANCLGQKCRFWNNGCKIYKMDDLPWDNEEDGTCACLSPNKKEIRDSDPMEYL